MTEETQSTEIAVPGIGQIVNLEDARACAIAIDDIRELEYALRVAKQDLTRALVHHSRQEGTKTLRMEGIKVEVKGGIVVEYDAEEIYAGLIDAGMSPERAGEIVKETVTRKVVAAEAKRASAANPAYREVIGQHTVVKETPFTVSVSRG